MNLAFCDLARQLISSWLVCKICNLNANGGGGADGEKLNWRAGSSITRKFDPRAPGDLRKRLEEALMSMLTATRRSAAPLVVVSQITKRRNREWRPLETADLLAGDTSRRTHPLRRYPARLVRELRKAAIAIGSRARARARERTSRGPAVATRARNYATCVTCAASEQPASLATRSRYTRVWYIRHIGGKLTGLPNVGQVK